MSNRWGATTMSRRRTRLAIGRRAFLGTAAGIAAGLAMAGTRSSPVLAQSGKHAVTIWCHFAGTNYEIFQRYVAAFNQATPDVEVKSVSYGPSEILPKYLASVAAGAPPDIFHAPGYVPPDFARNGVIIPLDGKVKLDPR